MPDGATHILIQIAINQFKVLHRCAPYALFGAVAPDLFKVISRLVSPKLGWAFYPTHSPIFMLVVFFAISLLFHQRERIPLIKGCMIGMIVHLFLDLFQINLGGGNYMPFFPFSFYSVSFGIIKTEASIFWLPITLIITTLIVKFKYFFK